MPANPKIDMWKYLWNSLFGLLGYAPKVEATQPSDVLYNNWFNGGVQPDSISTVYTCFRIVSQQVANLPLKLVNRRTARRYNAFGLQELLNTQPNVVQTWVNLIQAAVYNYLRHGNGFVRVHRNDFGTITGFSNLQTTDLYAYKQAASGRLILWFKVTDPATGRVAEDLVLNSNEVLHLKGLSFDGLFGISPLVALALNNAVYAKALQTANTFYERGAQGLQALESEAGVTGSQIKAVREETEQFMQDYHGYMRAGTLVPLPQGKKIVNITNSFKDSEMIAGMMFNKKEISSVLGVPLFMLGEETNGNEEQNRLQFLQNTISPILTLITQEFDKLLPRAARMNEDGIGFMFDTTDFVIETFKDKAEGLKNLVQNGVFTPNDAARAMGVPPTDSEWMNAHYMQAQMIPLEEYDTYGQKKGLQTRNQKGDGNKGKG